MNICFTGAHSTGKSTLVDLLHKQLPHFSLMKNARRILVKHMDFGIFEEATIVSQSVSTGYMAVEFMSGCDIVSDRSLWDTFAYTIASNMSDSDKSLIIDSFMPVALKCHDILFYTPIEFDIVDDGVRKLDKETQKNIDIIITNLLNDHNIEYHALVGTIDERMSTINKVLIAKGVISG